MTSLDPEWEAVLAPHVQKAARQWQALSMRGVPLNDERRVYVAPPDFFEMAMKRGFTRIWGLRLVPLPPRESLLRRSDDR